MAFLRFVKIPLLIAHCSEARFSSSPIQTSARLRRFRVHGLIDALITPPVQHISNPLGLEPLLHHKARKTSNNTRTVNNTVNPESVNLSPTQPAPGNRLNSSADTDIGPLTCCTCHVQYYFTAGEQTFCAQKNFDDQSKSCTKCRTPSRAGLGPQNLVISRRETPRNSKVPSTIGYPQDCPYLTLLGDDQATRQKLCPGTVLCLVYLNSVQGGLVKGNPVTCNHTCDSCQWFRVSSGPLRSLA